MKLIISGLIVCFIVIGAVIFNLFTKGIALRSAGVIKPTLIGSDSHLIAKSVALRLFPEFQTNTNVIWFPEPGLEAFVDEIMSKTVEKLKAENVSAFPEIILLKENESIRLSLPSVTNRWWRLPANGQAQLDFFKKNFSNQNFIILFVSAFDRNQVVPAQCEDVKILNHDCLRAAAVREVRKKLKSDQPYFFMRRYKDNEFYLFIEKKSK